jgi:hypothetical protein
MPVDTRARVEDAEDNEANEDIPEIRADDVLATPDNDDDGTESDDSDAGEGSAQANEKIQCQWKAPPMISTAKIAHKEIRKILHPPRDTGRGYKDPKLDLLTRSRLVTRSHLEAMQQFLWAYVNPTSGTYNKWSASSLAAATALEKGPWFARRLREWTIGFVGDNDNLPLNVYGTWNKSRLDDEDLQAELFTHLQGIGKYICADDVSCYMNRDDVKKRYGMKKGICIRTARNWLDKLGYRWTLEPSGQYVDGHERDDVVTYRKEVFLPCWLQIEPHLRSWSLDGKLEVVPPAQSIGIAHPADQRTVVWFHDESTFYENDRQKKRWVNVSETAVPRAKGEGASLMIAEFVLADYGWLRSPDNTESARVLFRAGKNREGYFTNENILEQTQKAIDIAKKYYPDDEHVFVFDNATTHQKRPATAVSASKMTKNPLVNFGCEVTVFENGKIRYRPDGKPEKTKLRMDKGHFQGKEQDFYDDNGVFKGMTQILEEHGLTKEARLRADCKGGCLPNVMSCCQRRVLYNQPDFADQESALEILCKAHDIKVLFLLKFHCELNFIEQCWGHAKRVYRMYPPSTKEEDLEKNLLSSLESVPLEVMRK